MFGVKTWLKERFKTRPAPLSRLSIDCIFRNIDLRKHNMTLTRQEIEAIHRDFVLPYQTHYLSQYSNFDEFEKKYNNKKWNWEGKDFPRCWALLEFDRYAKVYGIRPKRVLTTCLDPELEYIRYDYLKVCPYDPDTESNDLHSFDLPDKEFDLVLLNQTIEHLYDPLICLRNLYRHLVPGGFLYANVPVLNMPHSTPEHYWSGVTPVGLGVLCRLSGFNILEIGFWGNFEYLKLLFETHQWPNFRKLSRPIRNEPENPVITWILARKPDLS